MHSTIRNSLAFLIILSSVQAIGSEEKSICLSNERTYFSCSTTRGKILSICGIENNEELKELSYKFGSYEKTELTFPSKGTINPKSKFTYNNYFRRMTNYFRLYFINENYKYSVFKDYDGEISNTPKAGVIVTNISSAQSKDTVINCKNITEDETQKLLKHLTCNTDSALGCNR